MSANPSGANGISAGQVSESFGNPPTLAGAIERLNAIREPEQEPTESQEVEAAQEPQVETVTDDQTEQEQDSQPEPEVVMHTVKVNGEEYEVTEDELRAGYMKNSDYQNKTKALHQQREAISAKEAEIDRQMSDAQSVLDLELSNLESPEMLELKETDPETYLREMERVNAKINKFNGLREKRDIEKQKARQELAKREMEALEIAIPEWLDPEVKAKEGQAVIKRWKDLGYSDEQVADAIDHVRFAESRKAMLYDELMSRDLESKKVVEPPKAQKPGVSKAGEDRTSEQIKGMRSKLRKTGKLKDAAELLKQRNR